MTRPSKRFPRYLWIFLAFLGLLAAGSYYLLPFGPFLKPSSPNCGPEQWHWLGERFTNKADLVAYLKENELSLFSGTGVPRLENEIAQQTGQRMEGEIDWKMIEDSIQVRQRIGYRVFILQYQPLACPGQSYTLKVTSYGFSSLFGCCGV